MNVRGADAGQPYRPTLTADYAAMAPIDAQPAPDF